VLGSAGGLLTGLVVAGAAVVCTVVETIFEVTPPTDVGSLGIVPPIDVAGIDESTAGLVTAGPVGEVIIGEVTTGVETGVETGVRSKREAENKE